jgi:hypothetical protein
VHDRHVRDDHRVRHHQHDVATAVDSSVPLSATPQVPQVRLRRRGHPSVTGDAAPGSYEHVVVIVPLERHVMAWPASALRSRQEH